jgi:hypothetical protein
MVPNDEQPGMVEDMLASLDELFDQEYLAFVLAEIVEDLPERLLGQIAAAAETIEGPSQRRLVLAAVAERAPEHMLDDLVAAGTIGDAYGRAVTLASLAGAVPAAEQVSSFQAALDMMADTVGPCRSYDLYDIISRAPTPALGNALAAAWTISDPYMRVLALLNVADQLPEEARPSPLRGALTAARATHKPRDRAWSLVALAERILGDEQVAVVREALAAARADDDPRSRAGALADLARCFPKDEQADLIEEALAARDDSVNPAEVVTEVVERAPDGRLDQILAVARTIASQHMGSEPLIALARRLVGERRAGVVREALAAARAIDEPLWRSQALLRLIELAPEAQRDSLAREALAVARAARLHSRAKVLAGLVAWLSGKDQADVFQEALTVARTEGSEADSALTEVIHHAPDRLLDQALAAVRAMGDSSWRADALAHLAGRVPEPQRAALVDEALTTALAVDGAASPSRVIAELVAGDGHGSRQSHELSHWRRRWRPLLMGSSTRGRPGLLADLEVLLPILEGIGGLATLAQTSDAIIDVGEWWP